MRKNLGAIGEQLAEIYFENRGYQIIHKNFHCRFGEIDLIVQKSTTLIFVEVKTRTNDHFGTPEAAIDRRKLNKIKKTALYFLNTSIRNYYQYWRIDSIGIILSHQNELKKFKHLKNITNG